MVLQRLPSLYPMPSHAGLPPGHFLSLPPSYSQPSAQFSSGVPSTSAHTSGGLAPNIASLAGADFDVDVRTGFLPATLNVERLPSEWEIWEAALDAARGNGVVGETSLRIGGGRDRDQLWRSGIESVSIRLIFCGAPVERCVR